MDDRTNLMSPRPLGAGSQIDWYQIREVLGMGGLGITYRAHDNKLDREVIVREYLPTSYAIRHTDYSVKPITRDHEQRYVQGLANFLNVAKTLDKFNHDTIVEVSRVIETNNTAYMVMECEYGVSLDSIIDQCGTFEQNQLSQIFYPIFEGLQKIHELGLVHGSIKPSNIRIRENGSPVLLDFGSARQTSLRQPIESTALVNQDYMPLEQYSTDYGEQGPWTDIYSLAAIMYQGTTGAKPDEALSRSDYRLRNQPDTVQELTAETLPTYQQFYLSALHAGLTLQPQFRPQSLAQWKLMFERDLGLDGRQSTDASSEPMDDSSEMTSFELNTPAQAASTNPGPGHGHARIKQPETKPIVVATNEAEDQLDIPLGSIDPDEADDEFLNPRVLATQSQKQHRGIKSLAIGSAIAASIAALVGIMLLQTNGTNLDHTNSVNGSDSLDSIEQNATALADDPSVLPPKMTAGIAADTQANSATADALATITETNLPASTQQKAVSVEPIEPLIAALPTVFFDNPVPNDPQSDNPRTISEIAESTSPFSPIEGMGDELWKDKGCSDCHNWTRENLCEQGEFYNSSDDSKINRIQHPFDGYFKLALKNWAGNDCS